MRIVIIGSGNIAHFFAPRLQKKGHTIAQIYSPNIVHARFLADTCNITNATDQLTAIITDADVYILAVKDDALPAVAAQLHFPNKVVMHCAGAIATDVLHPISEHRAVIWTLYSIKKHNLPLSNKVPLVVEGNNNKAKQTALKLAKAISNVVIETDFTQRQMLHVNAVIVNNFTNHLFSIAQQLCTDNNLPFDILFPIIHQTLSQVQNISPSETQTGPAIRGDQQTIQKHIQLLSAYPVWQKVYADISQSIQLTAQQTEN